MANDLQKAKLINVGNQSLIQELLDNNKLVISPPYKKHSNSSQTFYFRYNIDLNKYIDSSNIKVNYIYEGHDSSIIYARDLLLNTVQVVLNVDESTNLFGVVIPNNTTNKDIRWLSNDTSIVTIDSSGIINAISAGETTILGATTDGTNIKKLCNVSVLES